MNKIRRDSDISEIAALVSEALERAGITAVLSGGAAVSIYTENAYMSRDLDFISSESLDRIEEALSELEFERVSIRYFTHRDTEFYVEFPSGPLAFGDDIVGDWARMETSAGVIQIVTPTQCVMDRLAAFYHWNDPQGLEQAVAVATSRDVDVEAVKDWSEREGNASKFNRFFSLLRNR